MDYSKIYEMALDLENEVKQLTEDGDGKIQINFNENCIVVSGGYHIFDIHRVFAWAVKHNAHSYIRTTTDDKPELLLFVAC